MSFWKDFLGRKRDSPRPTAMPVQSSGTATMSAKTPLTAPRISNTSASASRTVEIVNRYRVGDKRPLILGENPDVARIFSDPNPASPLMESEHNSRFWSSQNIGAKRTLLAVAFLLHPKPSVRLAAISLVREMGSVGVSEELINLLGDPDSQVARASAASVWEQQRSENCLRAVKALRDEIRGTTSTGTREGLVLGRLQAIRALDLLIDSAPNESARAAIKQIADQEIVIEERIKEVNTTSVRYAKTEDRRPYTYEIYNAPSREQALAFLKSKVVTQPKYYIEVETPEGTFGRDMNGIYW